MLRGPCAFAALFVAECSSTPEIDSDAGFAADAAPAGLDAIAAHDANAPADALTLYGETFQSRVLLGTSRYPSLQ